MVLVVTLVIVVLAVATGCGGGGNSNGGTAKRTNTPSAQDQAKEINLKLSDFPDGWRVAALTFGWKFRRCLGAVYPDLARRAEARSDDFAHGESEYANSEVQITKHAAQAREGMERLATGMTGTGTRDCLRDSIPKGPDYKVGEIHVGRLKSTPPPSIDEAKAWEIVIPVKTTSGEGKGVSSDTHIDVVFVRKGNVVGRVATWEVLSPLGEALRAHLVRAVAGRMS